MRFALRWLSPAATAAALLSCATAPTTPDGGASSAAATELVNKAVAAQGGADALAGIHTLSVKTAGTFWEPEQSIKPEGESRLANDSTIATTRDLDSRSARIEWVRKYVYPAPREYRFTEIVTPTAGQVQGIDTTGRTKQSLESNPPQHTMSGVRVAATQRELLRTSPRLLLEAQKNPSALSAVGDQRAGSGTFPAVKYQAGDVAFLVLFDRATGLPARIRTLDYDNIYGDSTYDLVLDDWRDVGGVRIAHALRYELNGKEIARLRVEEVKVNPAVAASAFELPADVRSASPKPTGPVPYQWVIRRPNIGTYLDSDAISYDPQANPGGLKLVEVAPGVQHVVGGSHNSLIVDLGDAIAVVDAPVGEGQSRFTIDAAKAKYPGKPVKYLVLTHHHMDHAGGARSYVAEGATIVVGQGNGDHFRRALANSDRLGPGVLAQNPRRAEIREVADRAVLGTGSRTLEVYKIDNPHVDPMLIAYIPSAKLGFVADLWSPVRDKLGDAPTPNQASLVAAVKKLGITPERFAGGHGGVAEYAPLEKLASNR
jgi:glyoxylase-like metal-dependent hydrolase (beta-lactamase superfamily II)